MPFATNLARYGFIFIFPTNNHKNPILITIVEPLVRIVNIISGSNSKRLLVNAYRRINITLNAVPKVNPIKFAR